MEDLYLKFPDAQTADDVLQDYVGSIDVIGTIIKVIDATDPEKPVLQTVPGWHVNVRGEATDELRKYALDPAPATPYRVWA